MALKKQTLSIPFARGLDQKTSEATGEPGTLSSAKNITMDKAGLISKRKGFETFRDSSTVIGDTVPKGKSLTFTTGANIYSYDEDLLVADGGRLYHKSGDTGLQDAGALIDCTYSRNQIYSDESKKIGQVRSVRVTKSGVDYDLMAWVQTDAITIADYELCLAVRDVKSGAFFRKPFIFETVARNSGTEDTHLWLVAPSIHLVKVNDTKQFIIYRVGNSSTVSSTMKARFIEDFTSASFSGSMPTPAISGSLRTLSNTATCIDVALSSDSASVFVAYYTQSSSGALASVEGPRIAKFTVGSSSLSFVSEQEVYRVVSGSVGFNIHDYKNYFYGNGFIPGISLHSTGSNLLVCFNAHGHHSSGRIRISIWCAVLSESLSQTNDSFQDTEMQNKVLANGGFVTGAFRTKGFITAVQGNSNSMSKTLGVENNNFASSRVIIGGVYFAGLRVKTYDLSGTLSSPPSPTAGQQYVRFYSAAATGSGPDTPSGLGWIRWENTSGGGSTSANIYLSIIEPGAGFKYDVATGKVVSAEQTQIEAWIKDQIGSWFAFPSSPTVTLEADTLDEHTRAPLHEILHLDFNNATDGFDSVTSVHQNATVVSDPMVVVKAGNTEILVAASRTNDNIGDANTFEFLTDADGVIHATGITGNSSNNVTSEYASMTGTNIRLLDSVSISESIGGNFEYATNTLIKTFLSSSDNSLESYIKHHEQIFAPARCILDLSPDRSLPGINGGSSFLIGGGTLFSYDGEELVENGYYESPSIRSLVAVSTSVDSRLTAGEFYSYSVVYEFVDNNGNLHESPPLAAVEVQTSTNFKSIALRIPTFDATRKNANRISIYRTRENGPLLKKIVSIEPSATQLALGYIDYVDLGESEEDFNDLPILYTTGGLLANNQPGSVTDLCEHKGRIIAATPTEFIIFSKINSPGFGYSFPLPSFVIDLPVDSSLITAIESNPNFLAIFTADDAYAVSGDGPNNLGVGAFTRPNRLAGNQGAIKGSPHISTVFGTFYVSERGIYLIAPNGQIQYIGAAVEDLVDNRTIKAIDYFDATNEIRFLCSTGDLDNDFTMICYNTVFQQWYSSAIHKDGSQTAVGQCLYSPSGLSSSKYHNILLSDGEILREGTGYTDRAASNQYSMDFEIKNISAAGLQGAQRIYRLMTLYDYHSSSALNMTITNDYKSVGSSASSEQHILTLAADFEQVVAHLRNQKSTAIRARFVVAAAGQGISFNGLALQVGVRPTAFKKPSAQIAPES